MAFTEFFCRSGGSNLNGGGLATGAEPPTAAAYTCTNSNWDGTSSFVPTDGSTPASTVSVGDFASVYLDGATVAVYVARVTVVAAGVNGAITLSTTAKSGTAPTSGATGRTIKVGGAWKGPNSAVNFPFGLVAAALTNAAGDMVRVNIKNDATYSITASIAANVAGPIRWQGYTAAAGDGGRATIDGGTSGASYVLLNVSQNIQEVVDLVLANNGASGSANGLSVGGGRCLVMGVVVHDVRGVGIEMSGTPSSILECEAYACNQSNTANFGGFSITTSPGILERCISHDNAGSNSVGFRLSNNGLMSVMNCIADTNGSHGFSCNGNQIILIACDAYGNGGSGISTNAGAEQAIVIENCNFVKNGAYGIAGTLTGMGFGIVRNCGFGSGTQANTSGTTNGLKSVVESGSITYASGVTPWTDPANGDFRISLAAAKGAGRGTFTQTQASYTGTVGYPDIGAAQHVDAAAGGGGKILSSSIIQGIGA